MRVASTERPRQRDGSLPVARPPFPHQSPAVSRRALSILFTACGVVAVFAGPASAQPEPTSRWEHNGSIMRLLSNKNERRFIYERVSPRIASVGVQKGTILFDGGRTKQGYEGIAHSFSTRCGPQTFRVAGAVAPDQRSVTVRGQRLRLDDNCRAVGAQDEILTFQFVEVVPFTHIDSAAEWQAARTNFVDRSTRSELILDHSSGNVVSGVYLSHLGPSWRTCVARWKAPDVFGLSSPSPARPNRKRLHSIR
jgi:hypothetical protein